MENKSNAPTSLKAAITASTNATHTVTSTDGTALAVQEWGKTDGPALLLLHAFGMTNMGWHPVIAGPLGQSHRIITFDHRGHGGSGKPVDPASYANGQQWADDIRAVIEALDLRDVSVVAWSMSGALFGDYLAVYGTDRIARVALLGAAHALGQPMMEAGQLGSVFADARTNLIHTTDFASQWLGFAVVNDALTDTDMDADTWAIVQSGSMLLPVPARGAILMRAADHLETYRMADVPLLVLHAEGDRIVAFTAAERLVSARPDARLVRLPGTAHAPHWLHTETVNGELAAFFDAEA
jgi:non-heme chloroperoxidase